MPFLSLLILPLAAAIFALIPWRHTGILRKGAWLFAALIAIATWWTALPIVMGISASWQTSFFLVDRFSGFMLLLITFVYVTAMLVSDHYLHHEEQDGFVSRSQVRLYAISIPLFVLSMMTSVIANNAGVLWIALEATTLTTTLLVAFYKQKASVEAAWKYIVLCSTGIALGLFGILMLAHAGVSAGLQHEEILQLSALREATLPADIVRWAFVFIFIGIGTKVGFVPMHSWLPDAHSKTPSPVSGMLSGVLLNVALFVLIRTKGVVNATLGSPEWTNTFFLVFGMLSLFVPACILLVQRNYKRMLAYSSVEHMGLIAFQIGLGPFGMVSALVHMAGHALTKSALFYGAGQILQRWKSTKFERVSGTFSYDPRTAVLFLVPLLLLLATPPSALFVSEYLMVGYGMSVHPWLTLLVLIGLTMVFIGMLRHVIPFLFGTPGEDHPLTQEKWNTTHSILVFQILCSVALGLWVLGNNGLTFFLDIASTLNTL